ncbi:ADP-ribose pyrophosphatase YjhB (NUDIX family) [Melghirimyces profundicolus]|uniref:ADP-ribose pyrophosphatase YjhB (NUDIX family) n=1 Tax=Melghirimyces profundicolus TaxID=1242148 RepID=A0A2T6BQ86_9BACL|nr:NUDIX domain-containing protein [Melghirimyces profundicolus]PTX58263.1 ADP-ribose pyrophosphatase YjhB (NUDIX family) [Melghirimyces profundicolus]
MFPQHYVAVTGVVLNPSEEVLLIRRSDNFRWEPPGGVVELADGLQSAVVREVKEETGVDAEVVRLTGVYKTVGKKKLHVVSLVFLCRALGGDPGPTDEAVEAGFFSKEEALKKVTWRWMRVRLTDALSGRKEPAVRNFMPPYEKEKPAGS